MSERVRVTYDRGVADVRLNRPDKVNALDPEMFTALIETGEALKRDPSVRAVVLSGEGRGFCAGLDFASFQLIAETSTLEDEHSLPPVAGSQPVPEGRITNNGQQAAWVWQEIEVPVIAAIHGVALGGGCQIALGADIRIVSPDSRMSVLEIKWGSVPDMTGTQILPLLVGLDVAKELTFTGRMVGGAEAVAIGLATRLSDHPLADALALAAQIAGSSPEAIRGSKRLLNMAGRASVEEGFRAEARTIAGIVGTANQIEAVNAGLEGRPATFVDPVL